MTNGLRSRLDRIWLVAEVLGSPCKSAPERAHKTGVMLVSDRVSNFLDRKVTYSEKLSCFLQPPFRNEAAKLSACLLFEQPLEICWTERYLQREIPYRTRGLRLDHFEDLTQAAFLNLECRLRVSYEVSRQRFQRQCSWANDSSYSR
jgi:hypothetical protein